MADYEAIRPNVIADIKQKLKEAAEDAINEAWFSVPAVPYHVHNGTDSPLLPSSSIVNNINSGGGGGGSGGILLTGTLQSNDANPVYASLGSLTVDCDVFIFINVAAQNTAATNQASFIRNGAFKVRSGVITFYDQIQDAFTMRTQSWQVDLTSYTNQLMLRVWGQAATTINWSYSANIVLANVTP